MWEEGKCRSRVLCREGIPGLPNEQDQIARGEWTAKKTKGEKNNIGQKGERDIEIGKLLAYQWGGSGGIGKPTH